MEINPCFAHIVGQTNAKRQLSLSIAQVSHGGDMLSPFLKGARGTGKTAITQAYITGLKKAWEERGEPLHDSAVLWFDSPNEFRLSDSAHWSDIRRWFLMEGPGILVIDECHEWSNTVQHATIQSAIRKALDRQTGEGLKPFKDDEYLYFTRREKCIVFLTNHDDKVDSAIASRFSSIDLARYSLPEMRQIIGNIFVKNEYEAENETVIDLIARAARGVVRGVVDNMIRDGIKPLLATKGTNVVTFETAVNAMVMKSVFPRGLHVYEVDCLQTLETGTREGKPAMDKSEILTAVPDMANHWRSSAAFLAFDKLAVPTAKGLAITAKGVQYLRMIRDYQFIE